MRKPYQAPKAVRLHPIYCDCCGTVKLAEGDSDKLVIEDRQHGKKHFVVIPLDSADDGRKLDIDV